MASDFLKFVKKRAVEKEGHIRGLNPSIKRFLKTKGIEFNSDKLKEVMENPKKTKGLITYRNALNNFFETDIFAVYENGSSQTIAPKKIEKAKPVIEKKIEEAPEKEVREESKNKNVLSLEVPLRKSAISFEDNYRAAKNNAGTKLPWLIRMENEEEGLVMEFSVTEAQKEKIRKGRKVRLIVEVL